MIIVLHNVHLEPINVIDLPSDVYEALQKSDSIRVGLSNDPSEEKRYAVIAKLQIGECEPGETPSYIYVVDNEVVALAFKPHWLPGQQVLINFYQELILKLNRKE